ncbi:NAC domain-containing protein 53-like [Daucus carota subsp. sativus]|uniref:NAC domain-containing protein 53-like n=1 Tax=Daucus carota subsp. sativus TaxID=79200 RepID=UPI0007EF5706|nr:PREDICTED: NAC domain-containing protein 53-like [Daucus carota subsp. sativus]
MAEQYEARPVKAFRFDPFDEELITDYLKPKIMGGKLPCNMVRDKEVYGPFCSPWSVFDPNDDKFWLRSPHVKASEKFMYVFAKLSKISSSSGSKNTSKRAGCGTWVAKTKRDQIKDGEGNVIGEKRYLVFVINEVGNEEIGDGYYSMHEYSLTGVNEGLNFKDTIVLCRITYDSAKKTTVSPKPGGRIGDHVSRSGKEVQFEEEKDSKNVEGTGSVTVESLAVVDSGVKDWPAIVQFNNGVQGSGDFGRGLGLGDLGAMPMDFYWDCLDGFDPDWIKACIDSNHVEEPFQDNATNLGHRKLESEENSYQAKKMCLDNCY